MSLVYFITHPDVDIDPAVPVPQWPLSARGRARMTSLLSKPWVRDIRSIYCSAERKAVEGAEILATGLGLGFELIETLGENDRSSTGYLPKAAFEAAADLFFARPADSVRGWERAVDAQHRIVAAMGGILARPRSAGGIAVVSHGAVGALYLCHLKGVAISRTEDQPATNGGNYFVFDTEDAVLRHGWRTIDA